MRKIVAILLCALMLLMVGCGGSTGNADNVGQIETGAGQDNDEKNDENQANNGDSSVEVSEEILAALGLSAEQWAAMDPAQQEGILAEMGVVMEQGKNEEQKEEQTKPASKTYTPDDVMAGGSYKVVLGDYMNSITLYYENGKLVKLVEDFQKSSEEEAYSATYEGDSLAEYGFNFIDWDGASLQEILDGMKDYGGYDEYRISKSE